MNRIALTELDVEILNLLISKGEMFGLEMVKSNPRLKRGSIYVFLARLEDRGFIESWLEEREPAAIGLPRRLYRITGTGERALRAWEVYLQAAAPAEAIP